MTVRDSHICCSYCCWFNVKINPLGLSPPVINSGINPPGANPLGLNPPGLSPPDINSPGLNPLGLNRSGHNPLGINLLGSNTGQTPDGSRQAETC